MSLLSHFVEVAQQVAVLFLLMGVGIVLAKRGRLSDAGVKEMTHLLLSVVTVCVIVNSFSQVEFSMSKVQEMLLAGGCSLFAVIAGGLITWPLFHKQKAERRSVLRFGVIFSNCGFMALPLANALFGNEGIFFVSIYLAVFQVCVWTYGVTLYEGGKQKRSIKKVFLNPGVIGIVIGMVLFLFQIPLPDLVQSPITFLADLNTPVAMIITGFYLASSKLHLERSDLSILGASLLRLLVVPLITLGVLLLAGVRGTLLTICMVPACTPAASVTTLFAVEFSGDRDAASRIIAVSTVLSILTMPLLIALTKTIS